jgi:hypothetical protein
MLNTIFSNYMCHVPCAVCRRNPELRNPEPGTRNFGTRNFGKESFLIQEAK